MDCEFGSTPSARIIKTEKRIWRSPIERQEKINIVNKRIKNCKKAAAMFELIRNCINIYENETKE